MANNPFEPEKMSVFSDDSQATFLRSGNDSSNQSVISLSESTAQLDVTRQPVYILLPNNQRLLVSMPQNATVQDLQFSALQRAARFGIRATLADSVIRTMGPRSAVLFGEDRLSDFMSETEDGTFTLEITGSVGLADMEGRWCPANSTSSD